MWYSSRREWLRASAAGLASLLVPGGRRAAIGRAEAAEGAGTNWAGNVTYGATGLHRPGTLDEVRRLVRESKQVKALGGRHSFSTIADTRGALISLERFDAVSEVDRAAGTVEVG